MTVATLRRIRGIQLRGSSPLLALKSDEQLARLVRDGHDAAFDALVGRYASRLAAFCRHLLPTSEDAEDVLQEVLVAVYDALRAGSPPIAVRPWLFRIARNRSLNHLRGRQARASQVPFDEVAWDRQIGDVVASAFEAAQQREEFRLIVADIRDLAENQRAALLLREVEGLSHIQIAEVMETTVPAVKCLLVRARGALAEGVEARTLSCEDVRYELCEVAEGVRRRSPAVRRHVKGCERCEAYASHLHTTKVAVGALAPIGALTLLARSAIAHLGWKAGSGGALAGGGAGAGASAGLGVAGSTGAGPITAVLSGLTVKATAGIAAAAVAIGAADVASWKAGPPARSTVSASTASPSRVRAPSLALPSSAAGLIPELDGTPLPAFVPGHGVAQPTTAFGLGPFKQPATIPGVPIAPTPTTAPAVGLTAPVIAPPVAAGTPVALTHPVVLAPAVSPPPVVSAPGSAGATPAPSAKSETPPSSPSSGHPSNSSYTTTPPGSSSAGSPSSTSTDSSGGGPAAGPSPGDGAPSAAGPSTTTTTTTTTVIVPSTTAAPAPGAGDTNSPSSSSQPSGPPAQPSSSSTSATPTGHSTSPPAPTRHSTSQ